MKFLTFLFLFINIASAVEIVECNMVVSDEAVELAETFDPKFCLVDLKAKEFNKAFAIPKDKRDMCDKCVSPLLKDHQKARIPNQNHKSQFIKATVNELKKGLSQTMLELMSLRSNIELGIDGESIANSCKLSDISNFPACQKIPNLEQEIGDIQKGLANEFAAFYSDKITSPGLMDRTPNNKCLIQDKDLIAVKNRYVESSLPQLVAAIKSMSLDYKSKTFRRDLNTRLLDSKNPELKIDIGDISAHPLIGPMLRDPVALEEFINASAGNQGLEELRSRLYSEGSKAFSDELKNKCEGYINTFKLKICGYDFAASNFSIETKNELELVMDSPALLSSSYFEKTKNGVIDYCQDQKYKDSKTVTFTNVQDALSKGLPEKYKDLKYSAYKSEMYKDQVETQRDLLCKIDDQTKECEKGTQVCELYKFWKESQDPKSKEFKLLGAHDPNIDKILRALIGKPKKISDDTEAVLVIQGIYPDPITKEYAVSDTPERKTDYYKTEAAIASATTTTNDANAKVDKKSKSNNQGEPVTKTVAYTTDNNTTAPITTTNPAVESEQDIRNDLQRKILDRLDNQLSAKQIEAMVAKAYNQGRATPLTPQQVTAKTKEILEEMPNDFSGTYGSDGSLTGGKAAVSRDPAKEKKAAQQLGFLKAKYGIDPQATPSGKIGNKVAQTGDEQLKVVSVDTPQDIKIVVDDINNLKGQEIRQLVEGGKSFILKVGETSYKINFLKTDKTNDPGAVFVYPRQEKIEAYFTKLLKNGFQTRNEGSQTYSNLKKAVTPSLR